MPAETKDLTEYNLDSSLQMMRPNLNLIQSDPRG